MKRFKIGAVLLAFILCFSLVLTVHAEPEDSAVIGSDGALSYLMNDSLYAFYELDDGLDFDSAIVNAVSTEITYKETGTIDKITDTKTNIKYLFIIDNSGSVKNYKENIKAFMESISDHSKLKTSYALATFGERFDVVKENMTDINTVLHEVDGIGFNEKYTDPYTAVVSADVWLHSNMLSEGDIVSVVLITDGDPDLRDADREDALKDKAEITIDGLTDVTYSTLCLDKWTHDADDSLTGGSGMDFSVKSKDDCKDAGEELASYFDSLIVSTFSLVKAPKSDFNYDLSIFGSDVDGNKVSVDKVVFENIHNEKNAGTKPEDDPDPSEQPSGNEVPNPKTPLPEPSEEEISEPVSETSEVASEVTDQESGKTPAFLQKALDFAKTHLAIVIAAGAGLLLIIAAIIVAVNVVKAQNKKQKKAVSPDNGAGTTQAYGTAATAFATAAAPAMASSVPPADMTGVLPMTLDVYVGRCLNTTNVVYLKDQLVIGSSPTSDIIFDDGDVEPQNSRIRLVDGVVYIEDMSSARGTAIGGMRIQGRNRLRSGDVISIGNVQFSVKY
ncbi:MAG: FHA domain-containing protein [Lachnospiraceae bacterium]|nr:FHA domain-containing protein [Lachnospiraceae bacterium]